MNKQKSLKIIAGALFYVAYQELTIRWAPGPPIPGVPGTPVGNELLHLATIGAVLGYGAWRFRKK